MKRLFAFTLLFQLVLLTAQAQKVQVKKCATCGKPIASCQYKGRHPKPSANKPAANKPNKPSAPKPVSGNINGHDWVDLGLSVKWATCNIGADKPEEYGSYYTWGETSTKSRYNWKTCSDYLADDNGYASDRVEHWGVYKIGGKTKIEPNSGHDAARQNWGGTWRMPTEKELEELSKKCTWKWTSKGGHNGCEVKGPNGNSIFLPAAGFHGESDIIMNEKEGHYMSNELSSPPYSSSNCICVLDLYDKIHKTTITARIYGYSVRPVTD